jgi:hypothetical protein
MAPAAIARAVAFGHTHEDDDLSVKKHARPLFVALIDPPKMASVVRFQSYPSAHGEPRLRLRE